MINFKDYINGNEVLYTEAFQKAVDDASRLKQTLFVPVGEYLLGTVELKSNVTIIFEDGTRLLGSKNLEDFYPDNILFDVTENCVIRPQIMLRFIRGVDATDVLLSSPCHALAIFYGGKISAFNTKPAAQIIDAIIDPLIKNKVEFASPALFNQLLPIGVAQTEEQKALIRNKNEPVKSWQKEQQSNAARKSGWNKLKSGRQ